MLYSSLIKSTVLFNNRNYKIKSLLENSFKGKVEFVLLENDIFIPWLELINIDFKKFIVNKKTYSNKQKMALKKYRQRIKIIGNKVYNLNKEYLGKCYDYQVEFQTGFIEQYCVKDKFILKRNFLAKNIVKIE